MATRDHIDKIIDHIRDYAADCDLLENGAADNIRTHVDALTYDLRGLGIDIDKRSFRLGMIFAWELSDGERDPAKCKYYSECGRKAPRHVKAAATIAAYGERRKR